MESEYYSQYISDIEIAVEEIKKMKLYPQNVIADFYLEMEELIEN